MIPSIFCTGDSYLEREKTLPLEKVLNHVQPRPDNRWKITK